MLFSQTNVQLRFSFILAFPLTKLGNNTTVKVSQNILSSYWLGSQHIENLWHTLKWFLRKFVKSKTKEELIQGIKAFWSTVTSEMCTRYIGHIDKAVPVVIVREGAAGGYYKRSTAGIDLHNAYILLDDLVSSSVVYFYFYVFWRVCRKVKIQEMSKNILRYYTLNPPVRDSLFNAARK